MRAPSPAPAPAPVRAPSPAPVRAPSPAPAPAPVRAPSPAPAPDITLASSRMSTIRRPSAQAFINSMPLTASTATPIPVIEIDKLAVKSVQEANTLLNKSRSEAAIAAAIGADATSALSSDSEVEDFESTVMSASLTSRQTTGSAAIRKSATYNKLAKDALVDAVMSGGVDALQAIQSAAAGRSLEDVLKLLAENPVAAVIASGTANGPKRLSVKPSTPRQSLHKNTIDSANLNEANMQLETLQNQESSMMSTPLQNTITEQEKQLHNELERNRQFENNITDLKLIETKSEKSHITSNLTSTSFAMQNDRVLASDQFMQNLAMLKPSMRHVGPIADDWMECFDPRLGRVYYHSASRKQSTWTVPFASEHYVVGNSSRGGNGLAHSNDSSTPSADTPGITHGHVSTERSASPYLRVPLTNKVAQTLLRTSARSPSPALTMSTKAGPASSPTNANTRRTASPLIYNQQRAVTNVSVIEETPVKLSATEDINISPQDEDTLLLTTDSERKFNVPSQRSSSPAYSINSRTNGSPQVTRIPGHSPFKAKQIRIDSIQRQQNYANKLQTKSGFEHDMSQEHNSNSNTMNSINSNFVASGMFVAPRYATATERSASPSVTEKVSTLNMNDEIAKFHPAIPKFEPAYRNMSPNTAQIYTKTWRAATPPVEHILSKNSRQHNFLDQTVVSGQSIASFSGDSHAQSHSSVNSSKANQKKTFHAGSVATPTSQHNIPLHIRHRFQDNSNNQPEVNQLEKSDAWTLGGMATTSLREYSTGPATDAIRNASPGGRFPTSHKSANSSRSSSPKQVYQEPYHGHNQHFLQNYMNRSGSPAPSLRIHSKAELIPTSFIFQQGNPNMLPTTTGPQTSSSRAASPATSIRSTKAASMPEWSQVVSSAGKKYWFNSRTGESTYRQPATVKFD